MDPQNPNSTDPNNPGSTNPVPGAPATSPSAVQPDLSSALGSAPPPVEPIPNPNLNPPTAADSSQIPTYTPPSWMNPTPPVTANPEPITPNPLPDVNPLDQNAALLEPNPAPPLVEPIPTYIPPASLTPDLIPPAPESTPVGPNPITEPNVPQSTAPVDLSQLISNAQQQVQTENPTGIPPNSTPSSTETIVDATPQTTTGTAVTGSSGFPRWLIGVAVGLLILVIGASAYFILGIGQSNTQTSLPATQTTGRLATPTPIPSPRSVTAPQPTTLPATSSARQQATSAADLIRLKQQGK